MNLDSILRFAIHTLLSCHYRQLLYTIHLDHLFILLCLLFEISVASCTRRHCFLSPSSPSRSPSAYAFTPFQPSLAGCDIPIPRTHGAPC